MGLSLPHSLTVTKSQDETRKITGMILDWFGSDKLWFAKVWFAKLSLVWLGQV